MIHALFRYAVANILIGVLYFLFFLLMRWHIVFDYLLLELVKCFKLLSMREMRRPLERIRGNTYCVTIWEDKMIVFA